MGLANSLVEIRQPLITQLTGCLSLLMANFLPNISLTCMDPSSWGDGPHFSDCFLLPWGKEGPCVSITLLTVHESGWKLLLMSKGEQYEEAVAEAKGWYPCCIRSWAYILLTWKGNKLG